MPPSPEVLKRLSALEIRTKALELRMAEARPLPKIGDGTNDVYGEFGINAILEFVELVAPGISRDPTITPELREAASMAIDTLQSLERMPR